MINTDFLNQISLPFTKKNNTEKPVTEKQTKKEKTTSAKKKNILLKTWRENVIFVWIMCVGLCLIIEFTVVPPIHQQALTNHIKILGSRSTTDIQHAFSATQQRLKTIANNQRIHDALINKESDTLDTISANLAYSFADVESLQILPWDYLGTAGLKQRNADIRNSIEMMMVAKAEGGTLPAPEVYRNENEWQIIFVAPIQNKKSTIGLILLRLNKKYLSRIINQQYYTDSAQLTIKHKGLQFIVKYGNPVGVTVTNVYPLPFSDGVMEIVTNTIQSKEVGASFYIIYGLIISTALLLTIFSFLAYLHNVKILKRDIKAIQHYMEYTSSINKIKLPQLFFSSLNPVLFTADALVKRIKNQRPPQAKISKPVIKKIPVPDTINDEDIISDEGIIKK